MSTLASVCTDLYAQNDRPSKWREFMSNHLGQTPEHVRRLETSHFEPLHDHPFTGRLEYGALGEMHFCHMICTPHRFTRSLSKILAPTETPWLLILQMNEVSHFEQAGKSHVLTPGEMLLLDCGRTFNVTSMKGCEYLMLLCHDLTSDTGTIPEPHFNSRNGLVRMLQHMIYDTYNQFPLMNDATSGLLGQSITSLLRNTLENQQQQANLEHDFHFFKKNRIKSFIEQNLAERELTIECIAEALECSVRTLHRAFKDETTSGLNEYIWQRRLARCAEELRKPENHSRSITDIAYGWGFNSSSHFSKAFRTLYGMPPRLFRESAGAEAS
ncbi:MAG: helix-turn-helix domain-containing protein [Pseudomonas sp.]|uniref:helix-turn-helix domain-containing protein n=1 Tax=Pseudomonas sp. TaxID=306 RepID=UPI00398227A8